MSLEIFKKLGIGESQPTKMALQLADISIVHPKGKMWLNDQELTFNIANTLKFPAYVKNYNTIESVRYNYFKEEGLVELFSPEEFFQDEGPEAILVESNAISNTRNLNL